MRDTAPASAPAAEAELEAFRQRWREEVSARNRQPADSSSTTSRPRQQAQPKQSIPQPTAGPSAARRKDASDFTEEVEPKAYHDLPDKEEVLKLDGDAKERAALFAEPSTALEHYERAVDKETTGQLGDSIAHYRKAFRLNPDVHEAYKKKHFPPSSFVKPKPESVNPSNAAVTVPGTAHHSLQGSSTTSVLPPTFKDLIHSFSGLRIEPPPPATDASPPQHSRFGELPEEILSQILLELAVRDVASFARLTQVCRRLAYLVMTEEAIWKRVVMGSEFGFAAMHYDYQCDVEGFPLDASDAISRYLSSHQDVEAQDDVPIVLPTPEERSQAFSSLTEQLLRSTYASSWRQLFRARPRVRFNGCYISTVNYTRPGATNSNSLTWGSPIHVVTYYRYLRFFRDGTCISLLTTTEPADVVHHLTKENLHAHHRADSLLPSAVMKDALRGRWRLSGPFSSSLDPHTVDGKEPEGEVHIETQGATPKYTYRILLQMSHAGKGARNNKLAWKGFWSWNKLTDDLGEFGLRHDRAFYWSRVRSFGLGY